MVYSQIFLGMITIFFTSSYLSLLICVQNIIRYKINNPYIFIIFYTKFQFWPLDIQPNLV